MPTGYEKCVNTNHEINVLNNVDMQPLRPRARIIRTLGEELITNESVAVIELVKNAYDADADVVLIKFTGPLKKGHGGIEVIDNGSGMELDVIRDAWMEPATLVKKYKKISKKRQRRVLGEKGIGRFATARLAEELELFSKIENFNLESYIFFDWTQFDNPDRYLDEILFLAEQRDCDEINEDWGLKDFLGGANKTQSAEKQHGTLLRMNRLKKDWNVKDINELIRGLSRLVSPVESINDFEIHLDTGQGVSKTIQIGPPEITKYPHYVVIGSIETNGSYVVNITINTSSEEEFKGRLVKFMDNDEYEFTSISKDTKDKDIPDNIESPECGPFAFEFRIWDRDDLGNVIQKIGDKGLGYGIRDVRRDLDSVAGINIYRDSFRVLPYGEPDNDFLRLDLRRVQRPTMRLSNNQILGYIEISADENPQLNDSSNREGLDNNQAYKDLQSVLVAILSIFENERYKSRRKTKQKSSKEKKNPFRKPDFSGLRQVLEEILKSDKEVAKILNATEAELNEQIDELRDVVSKYHSLATLGGLIDKVLHDCRQPLGKIVMQAELGQESINKHKAIESNEIVANKLEKILDQANILTTVFKRIEPFGGRKRGRPKRFYLEELIKDVFEIYEQELSDDNIDYQLPDSETLVSVDRAEFQEVVNNLLTNSIFWLKHVNESKRKIKMEINRLQSGDLEILFEDSGPGVSDEDKEFIFDPYFSNKISEGYGLGLTMAGEIVKDYYDGELELLKPGSLGGALFRMVLRKRVGS